MQDRSPKRVAIVVSSSMTVRVFLSHQLQALAERYTVTVVANMEGAVPEVLDNLPPNTAVYPIPIERQIRPLADLKALWLLYRFFREEKFDLVHSISPKAGLLSTVAGWLARIPRRLHTFTGQIWATRSGISRAVLKFMDRLIATFATTVLVDSPSQQRFLVQQGVTQTKGSIVLAEGSISGVDVNRFHPDMQQRSAIRSELKINEEAFLVLFVGRLKRDKGVMELVEAFVRLRRKRADAMLLLAGPDEENLKQALMDRLGESIKHVHFIPFTKRPEYYMMASDLLALPSYREGFGTVVIEAAACGVPAVASRIYGLTDAVAEGETGLLFEAGDVDTMVEAMEKLALDGKLCDRFGRQARQRARELFPQQRLTDALIELYQDQLQDEGR